MEKCESGNYEQWERHNIENPHFYDLMYLPQTGMYARLHLGGIEFDATRDIQNLMDDRDLYLTFLIKTLWLWERLSYRLIDITISQDGEKPMTELPFLLIIRWMRMRKQRNWYWI